MVWDLEPGNWSLLAAAYDKQRRASHRHLRHGDTLAGEERFMQRICRSGAPLLDLNVLSGDATEID